MPVDDLSQCVLIVDDEPSNINILESILSEEYQIKAAISGEKALQLARSGRRPDLILLDIAMPEMDGYTVCKTLKSDKTTADIPVIFVTAINEVKNEAEGLSLGAVDYITKPVNGAIVKARIRAQLELKKHRDQLEKLVQQRTEELEKAYKVKNEFVACVTHELMTPMTGVIGMCQVLKYTDLDDKQKKYVNIINSSSIAQSTILKDILAFSELDTGNIAIEKNEFTLNDIIETVINMVQVQALNKNLPIHVSIDKNLPAILSGDSGKLRQILLHLLGNAVKFTKEGEINIHVERSRNGKVKFSVNDTGIGIAEEHWHKLFEPFSQVDSSKTRSYGGLGLGLVIARRLVEQMGGEIGMESIENRGSTFWFCIDLPAISGY